MSDNPSTTDNPVPPETSLQPERLEPDATNASPEGDTPGEATNGSEAARWRRKLRGVESERDQLAERLATLQRAEVERLAAEHLAAPEDLWTVGTDMASLLGEDGSVDSAKVKDAVQGVLAERPHWGRHPKSPIPGKPRERLRGGGNPEDDAPAEASWAHVIGRR